MIRIERTRKGGLRGVALVIALVLLLALVPLSGTAVAFETLGFSGDISARMTDSVDAAENALFAGLLWANPRDMSDFVQLDNLSVRAEDGTEIYRRNSDTVAKIELSRTEKLSFALSWSADDREDFQVGDYFTFAIMECADFTEVGTEIPIDGNNEIVTATGEFNCVNGLLTCTVVIESLAPGYTLTEGTAGGWARLNAQEDATETEIRFQDDEFHSFQLKISDAGGTINAKPQTGEVVFIKSDYRDGDQTGIVDADVFESLTGLAGIRFALYQDGNEFPVRMWRTENGYYVSSEKPDRADATETDTIETNGSGIFKLIFVGEYLTKEYCLVEDLTGLNGYYGNQNQHISFAPNRSRGIYYAVYNVPRAVRLKKTDADSEKALAGVEFALYDNADNRVEGFRQSGDDGCYVYDGAGSDRLVTNESGILEVRQLPVHGRESSYYFVEVAPLEGYILDKNRYSFALKQDLDGNGPAAVLLPAQNVRYPYVELIKQGVRDSQNYPLSNVSFELYCAELGYSSTKVTGQDGRLVFDDLPDLFAGTYTLRESAPTGYEGVGDITIEIGQDGRLATPVWNARDNGKISWNASERCLTILNHADSGNGGSSSDGGSSDGGSSDGGSSGGGSSGGGSSGGGSSGGGSSGGGGGSSERDDYSGDSFTGGSTRPRDFRDRDISEASVPLTTIVDGDVPLANVPDNTGEGIPSTGAGKMVGTAVLLALLAGAAVVWNCTGIKR